MAKPMEVTSKVRNSYGTCYVLFIVASSLGIYNKRRRKYDGFAWSIQKYVPLSIRRGFTDSDTNIIQSFIK